MADRTVKLEALAQHLNLSLDSLYDLIIKQKGNCGSCQAEPITEKVQNFQVRVINEQNVLLCSKCAVVMEVMIDQKKGGNICKFYQKTLKNKSDPLEPKQSPFPSSLGF